MPGGGEGAGRVQSRSSSTCLWGQDPDTARLAGGAAGSPAPGAREAPLEDDQEGAEAGLSCQTTTPQNRRGDKGTAQAPRLPSQLSAHLGVPSVREAPAAEPSGALRGVAAAGPASCVRGAADSSPGVRVPAPPGPAPERSPTRWPASRHAACSPGSWFQPRAVGVGDVAGTERRLHLPGPDTVKSRNAYPPEAPPRK